MQVVVCHAPKPPERYQPVGGPGEVVAWMVLHRQPDVDHVEDHDGEWVAPEQRDVHQVKEAQGEQLPGAHVLRGQRERGQVLVVHLVEGPVQPGHFVVQDVPCEELSVKEQQAEHDVAHQLEELGGFRGQGGRAAGPIQQSRGEHEHHVLVECLPQAGQQLLSGGREVGVDLEATQRGHPGAQDIQRHEGQAEAHVGGDGEDDREEGRLDESLPRPQAVPEGLQEELTGATEDMDLRGVVTAHGEAVPDSCAACLPPTFLRTFGPAPSDVIRLLVPFLAARSLRK